MAMKKINKDSSQKGKGLAIAGIIIGALSFLLLIPLVSIGAIAYFGVLSPDRFLPERCSGPSGLDCLDKASIQKNGDVQIALKNNLGFEIEFEQEIRTTEDCSANLLASINDIYEFPITLKNGELARLKINCGKLDSGRFKTDITVNYRNNETGLTHSGSLQITGIVT
jgi:hypothetical protein